MVQFKSNFNFNFFEGSWPLRCPNEILAYILDFTTRDDLINFKQVCRGSYYFVMNKHQTLSRQRRALKTLKTYDDLEPIQKLKLEFLRFNDRPIHHRIGIGIGCIILSPVILLYYSPRMIWFVIKKTAQGLNWIICKIWRYVIKPILIGISQVMDWIYDWILTPCGHAIAWSWNRFCQGLRWINSYVIKPTWTNITQFLSWLYRWTLVPLGRGFSAIWNGGLMQSLGRGLQSMGRGLGRGLVWIWNQVIYPYALVPMGHSLKFLARWFGKLLTFIFKTLLWDYLLVPCGRVMMWIYQQAIVPACRWLGVIVHGFCIKFAYNKIIYPISRGTYNYIIAPVGQMIGSMGSFMYQSIMKPIYRCVMAPVGRSIVNLGKFMVDNVIVPCGNAVTNVFLVFTRAVSLFMSMF